MELFSGKSTVGLNTQQIDACPQPACSLATLAACRRDPAPFSNSPPLSTLKSEQPSPSPAFLIAATKKRSSLSLSLSLSLPLVTHSPLPFLSLFIQSNPGGRSGADIDRRGESEREDCSIIIP